MPPYLDYDNVHKSDATTIRTETMQYGYIRTALKAKFRMPGH